MRMRAVGLLVPLLVAITAAEYIHEWRPPYYARISRAGHSENNQEEGLEESEERRPSGSKSFGFNIFSRDNGSGPRGDPASSGVDFDMRRRVADLEDRFDGLVDNIQAIQITTLPKLEDQIEDLDGDVRYLRTEIMKLDKLESRLDSLEQRVTELEQTGMNASLRGAVLATLHGRDNQLSNRVTALSQQLFQQRLSFGKVEAEVSQNVAEIQALKAQRSNGGSGITNTATDSNGSSVTPTTRGDTDFVSESGTVELTTIRPTVTVSYGSNFQGRVPHLQWGLIGFRGIDFSYTSSYNNVNAQLPDWYQPTRLPEMHLLVNGRTTDTTATFVLTDGSSSGWKFDKVYVHWSATALNVEKGHYGI